jgi:glycosyltransferase involved in cell wall biosynthesis
MQVTVIIPYKEDRGYLHEAIDSVNKQTYKNIQLILSQSDNSVGYNLNRGIEKATGDVIRYLCDDDKLPLTSIERQVNAFKDYDMTHGNAYHFWNSGKHMQQKPRVHNPVLKDMYEGNVFHGGTVMYRASNFEKFGMFDESLWTGEEFDLNLSWLSQGAKVGYCDYFLYLYRRHQAQKSVGVQTKEYHLKRVEAINAIRDKYRCKL